MVVESFHLKRMENAAGGAGEGSRRRLTCSFPSLLGDRFDAWMLSEQAQWQEDNLERECRAA